jgi:2-dehydropantoate 2-reductase
VISSRLGDVMLPQPPTVTADMLQGLYDLVLLSCKAYDLATVADSLAPAIGPDTAILPLLNGISHMDFLAQRFGGGHVLGGQCLISAALDGDGRIAHLNDTHLLSFGEPDGTVSALSGARFEARLSAAILQEMWDKWVFIAAGAGITCLMRAAIGDIVAAGAANLATALYDECCAIAGKQGFVPSASAVQRSRSMFTSPGSTLTASMLRDIERGAPIEADHVIGDLLRRGDGGRDESPLLRIAYAHLKAYEARRSRETAVMKAA